MKPTPRSKECEHVPYGKDCGVCGPSPEVSEQKNNEFVTGTGLTEDDVMFDASSYSIKDVIDPKPESEGESLIQKIAFEISEKRMEIIDNFFKAFLASQTLTMPKEGIEKFMQNIELVQEQDGLKTIFSIKIKQQNPQPSPKEDWICTECNMRKVVSYMATGQGNRWMCEKCAKALYTSQKKTKKVSKEVPMGCSQWRAHGEKYGYWDYFKAEIKAKAVEEQYPYADCDDPYSCCIH